MDPFYIWQICSNPYLNLKKCLHFTECPMGLYGPNCQNNCSLYCAVSKQCDFVTGECIGGCQAGWKGSKCDESKAGINLVGECMFKSGTYLHFVLLVQRMTLMYSFVGLK